MEQKVKDYYVFVYIFNHNGINDVELEKHLDNCTYARVFAYVDDLYNTFNNAGINFYISVNTMRNGESVIVRSVSN